MIKTVLSHSPETDELNKWQLCDKNFIFSPQERNFERELENEFMKKLIDQLISDCSHRYLEKYKLSEMAQQEVDMSALISVQEMGKVFKDNHKKSPGPDCFIPEFNLTFKGHITPRLLTISDHRRLQTSSCVNAK